MPGHPLHNSPPWRLMFEPNSLEPVDNWFRSPQGVPSWLNWDGTSRRKGLIYRIMKIFTRKKLVWSVCHDLRNGSIPASRPSPTSSMNDGGYFSSQGSPQTKLNSFPINLVKGPQGCQLSSQGWTSSLKLKNFLAVPEALAGHFMKPKVLIP